MTLARIEVLEPSVRSRANPENAILDALQPTLPGTMFLGLTGPITGRGTPNVR